MRASTCRILAAKDSIGARGQQRLLSVVAWGRNAEGQCGTAGNVSPLVLHPSVVAELEGQDIVSLSAGSLNSAAVASDGTCYTWGSGKGGKLGHGNSSDITTATRVESLVGRTELQRVALGLNHTLFLDQSGSAWSCGDNKEGQCGFGTSLEVLAKQRRQEWNLSVQMAKFAQGIAQEYVETLQVKDSSLPSPAQHAAAASHLFSGSGGETKQPSLGRQAMAPKLLDHSAQARELEQTREMVAGGLGMSELSADSHFGNFGKGSSKQGTDPVKVALGCVDTHSRAMGCIPGHHTTPMRMGHDEHGLLAAAHGKRDGQQESQPEERGIGSKRIVDIAASNHFSMLLTDAGEVYTCGGGFNGELGHSSSWLTSASQVEGHVRQALLDNGGATAVACGATFSVALTASGRVVVWGGIAGCKPPPEARRAGGVVVAEVMGLPPISHISTGHHHAILSDGDRVWTMGTWLDKNGRRVGTEWGVPKELEGLPRDGIRCISAGARASAAVTDKGDLYMWGCLMAEDNARALVQQATGVTKSAKESAAWMWEGMGGDNGPQKIPWLPPVHSVQLGAAHVLALVH